MIITSKIVRKHTTDSGSSEHQKTRINTKTKHQGISYSHCRKSKINGKNPGKNSEEKIPLTYRKTKLRSNI